VESSINAAESSSNLSESSGHAAELNSHVMESNSHVAYLAVIYRNLPCSLVPHLFIFRALMDRVLNWQKNHEQYF
jgi:hypothetical protein